jgi:hypothetical protein
MQIQELNDNIFYVKGLISQPLCQSVIEKYTLDSNKHAGLTTNPQGETEVTSHLKVSTDLFMPTDAAWEDTYNALHEQITSAVVRICMQNPALQTVPVRLSGYTIQHYKKNEGHFKWHVDSLGQGSWDRQMAMVLYLNSVEDGGETSFSKQNIKVKPTAGDAVFFPTFWTHRHCGEMPRSNDKYIISSFMFFCI